MCAYSHIPARSGGPSSLLLDSADLTGPGGPPPQQKRSTSTFSSRERGTIAGQKQKHGRQQEVSSSLTPVCPIRKRLRTYQSCRRKQVKVQLSPTRLSTSRRHDLRFQPKTSERGSEAAARGNCEINSTISEFGGVATSSAPFAGSYFSVNGVECQNHKNAKQQSI